MKAISAILLIYILGLIFVPCTDAHADSNPNTTIEIVHAADEHADLCSPFCFCDCCQTLSHQAKYFHFDNYFDQVSMILPNNQYGERICILPHWRPPIT